MLKLKNSLLIAACGPVVLSGAVCLAGGIDVPQQGARADGQAEAFSAQADDASAIYFNPAGLTQLHGTVYTGGASLFVPSWEFHGNNGQEQGMHLPSVMPYGYLSSDLGLKKWRFGFGLNNDEGLNEDWGTSGSLSTLVQRAHIYNINMAPTVAYQINDHLSIGSALNVYYGQLEQYRSVVLGPPGTPEGNFHFRGQDWALGATPGIMWKIDDRSTIAAVYRSGYTMQYSGKARVGAGGRTLAGPSHTWAEEDFPQSATLAYAFRPIRPLKLEADVVWTDWNAVNNVTLSSNNPAFNQKIPADWMSGFEYRFGAQYDLTSHWAIRGGYAFGQNAVPSDTFAPLVPDSNYHLISAGISYSRDNWSIDAAYQFIYRETRHIGNSIYGSQVDGSWDNHFNEFLVSLTIKL
jgi:long-chain fatty acid transport protein